MDPVNPQPAGLWAAVKQAAKEMYNDWRDYRAAMRHLRRLQDEAAFHRMINIHKDQDDSNTL